MSDFVPGGSFAISHLEQFTCAQCEEFVVDNSKSVRWYDVDCCSLKCFRAYFERSFRACAACQTVRIDGNVHFHHSAHGIFAFCDISCMDTYRSLYDTCSFCFVEVSKNGRTTSRIISKKKYCSLHCMRATGRIAGAKFNGGSCHTCSKKHSTAYQIKFDKENLWIVCSDDCLKLFELNEKVKLATCLVCHIKFNGNSCDAAQLMEFGGEKWIFCSSNCLSHHLKNDPKRSACIECGESFPYYAMIRTLSTNEAEKMWCSLNCAERHASAVTPPRLRDSHIETVNRKFRDVSLNGNEAVVASVDKFKGRDAETIKVESMVESRTKYKIPINTKEQIDISLSERRESFRLKCFECVRQIGVNEPVLRWQTMNFCSRNCLLDHMLEMHDKGLKCTKCQTPSRIDILGDMTCRIGNETRFFCGTHCNEEFVRDLRLCDFCLKQMDDDGHMVDSDKRFCSERCAGEYENLYAAEKMSITGECTDCEKVTALPIQLLYNGKDYGFCSFRCFFFLKYSCGIYADQCEMCEKYFERNLNEMFNVRHNDLTFIFCSQICVSHFILKHRVMNICSFCGQEKYNFDMIHEYNGHGQNRMVCSMKCLGYNQELLLLEDEEVGSDASNDIAVTATHFRVDKMISCQPEMEARATQSTFVETRNARTQTDAWSMRGVIPIPVPIYMPQPCLLPRPLPLPVPFVLPVIVPIVLRLNNSVGRFMEKTNNGGATITEAGRISEFENRIDSTPLTPISMVSGARETAVSSCDFDETSEYESSNDELSMIFERRFVTSTPIGNVAADFSFDSDRMSMSDGPVCENRRLKPDAFLDDIKEETDVEFNVALIFPQPDAHTGIRMGIKRSLSVDSMENEPDTAKKQRKASMWEDDEF